MPFVWVEGAISLYSAYEGISAAGDQKRYADHAEYRADTIFNEQQGYAKQLQDLMANPGQYANDPEFTFGAEQGSKSLARTNAAGGFLNSGKAAAELTRYGQDYAHTFIGQKEELLASLSGLRSNPEDAARTAQGASKNAYDQEGDTLASLAYMFSGTGSSSLKGALGGMGGLFSE